MLQGKICGLEVQVGSVWLGEALMHGGQQASLGQALGGLGLEVGFIHSPGAGALVTTTTAPSGTQRRTGGHLSSQSFLLPFIPIKYLSRNISPRVGLETFEDCVCVCLFHVYNSFLLHNCFG